MLVIVVRMSPECYTVKHPPLISRPPGTLARTRKVGDSPPQKAHPKRSAFFPPTTGKNIYISKIYGLAECILVKEFESTEDF